MFFTTIIMPVLILSQCLFYNTSHDNMFHLAVNTKLDCVIHTSITCNHTFSDNICPIGFNWSQRASYCDYPSNCCANMPNDYHSVSFTCTCQNNQPTYFNSNMLIITNNACKTPTAAPHTQFVRDNVIGFILLLTFGLLTVFRITWFIYYEYLREKKRIDITHEQNARIDAHNALL